MGTPLYTTDIIPMTSRPTLTVMDDGDYFVILDTSTGKISKILKTLAMEALKISYDNTSGLTAETVQAALDELVVNLGSSDSAILALSGRLDTLEGTGAGSVAKAIDDALEPVEEAIALKEASANKKTTLADSDVDFPTSGAVIDYAVKLTKMPDGATAVYSQDAWATADGWVGQYSTLSVVATVGSLRVTATGISAPYIVKSGFTGIGGKTLCIRVLSSGFTSIRVDYGAVVGKSFTIGTGYMVLRTIIPIGATRIDIVMLGTSAPGYYFELDYIWIGDYSYLENSLATEASRIANQIGDTAGVGTKASGTITSNGANVSDGDTVTIAGKVYTFKTILGTTEGNVLIGGTAAESLDNLKLAINSTGVTAEQYCAAINPLVEATTNTDTVQTLSARTVGILGNSITLAKLASTLTLSGATLTGGTDDVGQKIYTQVKDIVAGGTRPAQADISDTSTIIGYENSVDVASGGTTTLPAGGTFRWAVYGYGATIASAKKGTSAGGTTLTVAGANATVWYRRIA